MDLLLSYTLYLMSDESCVSEKKEGDKTNLIAYCTATTTLKSRKKKRMLPHRTVFQIMPIYMDIDIDIDIYICYDQWQQRNQTLATVAGSLFLTVVQHDLFFLVL